MLGDSVTMNTKRSVTYFIMNLTKLNKIRAILPQPFTLVCQLVQKMANFMPYCKNFHMAVFAA
jgi:hypothetical protein